MTQLATLETHVVDLILDEMVAHLQLMLIDNIPSDNKSRAKVVKKGLIVENKTVDHIQLGVQAGDHEDPEMEDGIASLQKLPEIGLRYATREIGGSETWVRRGVVRLEAFFVTQGYSEEDAFRIGYAVLGRATSAIATTPIAGLRDDFGEQALTLHPYATTYHESGGPPSSYIFRGKIKWICFTERLVS